MDWKRVEEIEARVSAATEGPWLWDVPRRDGRYGEVGALRSMLPATVCEFGEENCSDDCREGTLPSKEDRDFMAHARSDVPWLIERLREMQGAIDSAAHNVARSRKFADDVFLGGAIRALGPFITPHVLPSEEKPADE